jgi:hypothetical protein
VVRVLGLACVVTLAAVGCQVISPPYLKEPRAEAEVSFDNDPLSLAANCLEQGNDSEAVPHLINHMRRHPEQVMFRMQIGEILYRLKRWGEAHQQMEDFVAGAQDGTKTIQKQLIHAHTRLMEIAKQREDDYTEHLNRGIGLFLIADELGSKQADPAERQRLLIRSANELKLALELRTDEARPAWYLHRVWADLDQPRAAEKMLRKARSASAFTTLTPKEQSELQLACISPGLSGFQR